MRALLKMENRDCRRINTRRDDRSNEETRTVLDSKPVLSSGLESNWVHGTRMCCLLFVLWIQPIVLYGQIGISKSDLEKQPGVTRTYSRLNGSKFEWYESKGIPTDPATKTYVVYENRVCGISYAWPGELNLDETLWHLNRVTGLSLLKQSPKKAAWKIDTRQAEAFPPLGAWESRPVNVPIFSVVTGARSQWTEYYNKWGGFVGSSPVHVEPIVRTYTRYAGDFRYSATKLAVPMVRVDGSAYAWVELSDYSQRGGFMTNRLNVAKPDFYRRSQLDEIQSWRDRFAKIIPNNNNANNINLNVVPVQKSLDRLRPNDLKVAEPYHRVLLNNVPNDVAAIILDEWELRIVLGALDDVQVPIATVREFAASCPASELCSRMMLGIKKCPVEASIRRADMLDRLGSLKWVQPMADLLKQKNKSPQVLKAMQTFAARHGASTEELDDLGTDELRWDRWHRAQVHLAKKK